MRHKINSLVIDRSRLFRSLIQEVLERYDCPSDCCSSGEEAIAQLQSRHYNLVCASYHLGDMNGETFTQKVRQLKNGHNTRIVWFAAEDDESLLKQALLAGATDIFSKQQFALFEIYLQRLVTDCFNNIFGQVLLVEDSPSQLQWLESLLIDKGLDVDAFSNSELALSAFLNNDYDLVITDVVLNETMSGLALVREIRRNPTDKGLTPIFAISAYDDISRRIELYHVGVNDYMTKPVIAEELTFRVANLIRSQRLVVELSAERAHLQEIALLDPVTGLYNRNAFEKFAAKEMAVAVRSYSPISIAVLDIDFFKRINDTYGHETGDKVLSEVGLRLRNTLRKGDMVFRWGGEEFVMILNQCPPQQALQVLEKQRARFNKWEYAGLNLTASIGVSGVEQADQQTTVQQLFKQADDALHKAKSSGRDQIRLND